MPLILTGTLLLEFVGDFNYIDHAPIPKSFGNGGSIKSIYRNIIFGLSLNLTGIKYIKSYSRFAYITTFTNPKPTRTPKTC